MTMTSSSSAAGSNRSVPSTRSEKSFLVTRTSAQEWRQAALHVAERSVRCLGAGEIGVHVAADHVGNLRILRGDGPGSRALQDGQRVGKPRICLEHFGLFEHTGEYRHVRCE